MGKYLSDKAVEWRSIVPKTHPCTHLVEPGVQGVFLEGIQNTRIFAWVGLPEQASKEHPVPGIVLVSGGGGTAFARWVRYWNRKGFAAISMDTCGGLPLPNGDAATPLGNWPRHSWSGPRGWGAWDQADLPPEKQWFTHAISAITFSHNLLRSMPEVQADRIGITGISWGAVLTCIAAGVDPRYKAVCPVYGNGFLFEQSSWKNYFSKMMPEQKAWWKEQWDPSNYLENVNAPTLWFASSNDAHFVPPVWQRSTDLVPVPADRCMKIRWLHSHGVVSEEQREIDGFFLEHLADGPHRIRLDGTHLDGNRILSQYSEGTPKGVMVNFTLSGDEVPWPDREWITVPAEMEKSSSYSGRISFTLPEGVKACYVSAVMEDLQIVTSKILFC